ncbi:MULTISPECIES: MGMT family protein [Bacillaceae]|uniref:DNA methyltransferase n=1 Tax=Domibacillus aminovorans TaxID=29332 RepID=A0A177L6M9_9BACI|nr:MULTISPECIES: MGMT family protein [Bacillaceae]OAH52572.1 DNA methyltransferase [Domibacillus aminovorans]OAH61104.1 DNA methyltransferase [Domibacillus aminovorans]
MNREHKSVTQLAPFTAEVVQILKEIPPGYVVTYGQVARMAGSPRAARQVVRILHSMSEKYGLPWHRVVNAKGEIAVPNNDSREVQRLLLEAEGVSFTKDGRVDLARFEK